MNKAHILEKVFIKKITILVLFAILIYIVVAILAHIAEYKNYQKSLIVHKENIDQLAQDNLQLNDLLTFLNTDDAVDGYARTRLNLQKEGERAFIITDGSIDTTTRVNDLEEGRESNVHKWIRYYFN